MAVIGLKSHDVWTGHLGLVVMLDAECRSEW